MGNEEGAMQVLLIGVYRPLLQALRRGLEEEGFTVDVAYPGPNGNGSVRAGDCDVVLLDVGRPVDAAVVLVQSWRRAGWKTPVLALTAPGDGDLCAPEPASPADDVLIKPFDFDELLARLRALARCPGRPGDAVLCGCSRPRN
jgi:DNA-binding response OmpR family regulator